MAFQVFSLTRRSYATTHRAEALAVLRLGDRIASVSRQNHLTHPALASDAFTDYLYPPAINVMAYERHRQLLRSHELIAFNLMPRSRAHVLDALRQADFVVLTQRPFPARRQSPFNRSMAGVHDTMSRYCRRWLRVLEDVRAPDRRVILFGR